MSQWWAEPHLGQYCLSMPISGPSLQNPKGRLGSVPYFFAPLPNVATLTKSFFCLPLLTVSLRIGDRTGLGAQVVTPLSLITILLLMDGPIVPSLLQATVKSSATHTEGNDP